ncbi:Type II secretion system protein GspN [Oxalobacteraceae bacterium]
MRIVFIWIAAALLIVIVTVVVMLPAAWLAPVVEKQTGGRFSLGDAEGSLWQGSAFLGVVSAGEKSAMTRVPLMPLLPGRFYWRLSPMLLLGRVDMRIDNRDVLTQPVNLQGNWHQWILTPSALQLPAERLSALGAPLNTLKPSGRMRLSWEMLTLSSMPVGITIDGPMQLDMTEIASALSPVKPLGDYQLQLDWRGALAQLTLKTLSGPLQLRGSGVLANGRLQFSGEAWAQEGQEQRLAILLNLLGQRRQQGNRNIIALEFK